MIKRTLIAATLTLGIGAGAIAQQGASSAPTLQERVDALAQQIHRRYQHFPPALASRRAAAEEVLTAWNHVAPAGTEQTSPENAARMTEWLDTALRAVMPGGSGELPATPEFEEPVVAAPEEALSDEALPTPGSVLVAPKNHADITPLDEPQSVQSQPQATIEQRPQRSRIKVSDPVATIDNPYVDDDELAIDAPKRSNNPLRQSEPKTELQVESKPSESQFVGPRATAKPVVPQAEGESDDSVAPQRSKWSQHPSAAPLEWRDPFTDDPAASANPLRSGERHQTLRPEFKLSRSTNVDLRQLAADIRGYNAALRSLQSVVMQLKASDVAALAAASEELDRLDERRQFLDLYRNGLTKDEQSVLPESPSAEVVRELVRRKTETLSDRATSSRRDERRAQQADWFEGF